MRKRGCGARLGGFALQSHLHNCFNASTYFLDSFRLLALSVFYPKTIPFLSTDELLSAKEASNEPFGGLMLLQ
jgi:hypothetical protein